MALGCAGAGAIFLYRAVPGAGGVALSCAGAGAVAKAQYFFPGPEVSYREPCRGRGQGCRAGDRVRAGAKGVAPGTVLGPGPRVSHREPCRGRGQGCRAGAGTGVAPGSWPGQWCLPPLGTWAGPGSWTMPGKGTTTGASARAKDQYFFTVPGQSTDTLPLHGFQPIHGSNQSTVSTTPRFRGL